MLNAITATLATDRAVNTLVPSLAFVAIGCLTFAFSFSRSALIRTFATADAVRASARSIPRGQDYRTGMRVIAILQAGIGVALLAFDYAGWRLGVPAVASCLFAAGACMRHANRRRDDVVDSEE